jgi:hypothetical protein
MLPVRLHLGKFIPELFPLVVAGFVPGIISNFAKESDKALATPNPIRNPATPTPSVLE